MERNKAIEFVQDNWKPIAVIVAILLIIMLVLFSIGPARLHRYYSLWRSDAYGANWLVLEQNEDRKIVQYWELKKTSVGNEEDSDGIYFTDENGFVIHLSAPYKLVEIPDGKWEEAKKLFVYPHLAK